MWLLVTLWTLTLAISNIVRVIKNPHSQKSMLTYFEDVNLSTTCCHRKLSYDMFGIAKHLLELPWQRSPGPARPRQGKLINACMSCRGYSSHLACLWIDSNSTSWCKQNNTIQLRNWSIKNVTEYLLRVKKLLSCCI